MCADASSAAEFQTIPGSQILAEQGVLESVRKLAWVDVINSGTWILVVALLEIDVWLHEKNRLSGTIEDFSKLGKVVLYSVLLGAAIYWGIAGPFLDFWDAFLWLFAFRIHRTQRVWVRAGPGVARREALLCEGPSWSGAARAKALICFDLVKSIATRFDHVI